MLALLRRARGLGVLGVAGLLLSLSVPAQADTAGAEAHATKILARVQRLQTQVKKAEHAYDRALNGVAASVNNAVQTDQVSRQIAAQADAADEMLDNRVRGLYMSGGPLAIYASLLDSGSVTEFQNQLVLVGHV